MKVASVLRTLAEVATEPKFAVVRGEMNDLREQVRALHTLTEHTIRKLENERSEMEETRRMVGIACARIENFIKLQKEQHADMEQAIATLLPLRALVAENA
jgi:hypothetical protein